jgi:GNAT superfamily N-acetyltransferase
MRTTHRAYSEEAGDFRLLCRFVQDNAAHQRACGMWSIGRLVDWKYGLYDSKRAVAAFCERNAHLWFDGLGDLVGVVISESGDADVAALTTAGHRFLYEEMLTWAMANWGDRGPRMGTEITEHQGFEARVLERHGFGCEETFYVRRFDLTQPLAPRRPLEPGFTIIDMATHPDYRAQRILRDNAFSGIADPDEDVLRDHLEFYNHSHYGPVYHAPLDLCVMAEDGRLVAGCEGLLDARNLEADIERVCTHSEYRRRGFARAVIQECLYRLQEIGMRAAYIAGYSPAAIALYGSLGATEETRAYVYRTVPDAASGPG